MAPKHYHVDWPRTIAGALAAVAAAVVLSKLGAAGTLIGAAIGSVVISVGTNIGASGIHSTRERMLEAQREAARRVSLAQAEVRRARAAVEGGSPESQARLAEAEQALASSQSELAEDVPTSEIPVVATPPVEPLAADHPTLDVPVADDSTRILPSVLEAPEMPPRQVVLWRRVAIFAVASFVIALVAITGFELISGRPLSAYMGNHDRGLSILPGGGGSNPKPSHAPSPSLAPSPSPRVTPTPSSTPTPTNTPTPSGSTSPTPSQSATPTGATTPTGVPTATNTP